MLSVATKALFRFANHQAKDLKQRRGRALYGKIFLLLAMGLALIPVLLIRVSRPLVLVRFGEIPSDRIAHFVEYVEVYLSEQALKIQPPKAVDIFHYNPTISNFQMKKMSDRELRVISFAYWLDRANRWLPGGEKHSVSISIRKKGADWKFYDSIVRTTVNLSFTPEETRMAREGLSGLGIRDGAPFVCFIARDSAYLEAVFPDYDWRYHDYRNCAIQNYVPAAEELAQRGYFAVRMGSIVKEALTTSNPMVVDYPTQGTSDFLDMYLSSNCRFFLTCGTGVDSVATVFRKPIACANYPVLGRPDTWGPNDLLIPKKLWLSEEGRFLTFREWLDSGASSFTKSEQFDQLGIQIIENTAEEITGLAVEMDERLNGSWITTEEDEELQGKFWSLFEFPADREALLPRVGAQFLRGNRFLLD